MIAATQFQLVVVTPEKTLIERPVHALQFPLEDGQIGILPGRAPMVGRMGFGELVTTEVDGTHDHVYVDGGFCQIKGGIVSVLTNRAIPVKDLTEEIASEILAISAESEDSLQVTRDKMRAAKIRSLADRG